MQNNRKNVLTSVKSMFEGGFEEELVESKEGVAVKTLYNEGGIKRFYRGFFLRCYAVIAGVYIMGKVSENVKTYFRLSEN